MNLTKDKKFIMNGNKIRPCAKNYAKMGILGFMIYHFTSYFINVLGEVPALLKSMAHLLLIILLLIFFPIGMFMRAFIEVREARAVVAAAKIENADYDKG